MLDDSLNQLLEAARKAQLNCDLAWDRCVAARDACAASELASMDAQKSLMDAKDALFAWLLKEAGVK
jgi:hypothetical protein